MKTRPLLLALAIASLLAACNRHSDDTAVPADTGTAATPADEPAAPAAVAPPPAAAPMVTDGLALALVATIDQQEIDAGSLAQKLGTRADVKAYALMLQTDHQANLTQAQDLGNKWPMPMDDARIDEQVAKGETAMAKLQAADAASFDATYLQAMVDGHADALARIDSQLLPAAQDALVRAFLGDTRAAVSRHLDQARALQAGH